MSNLKHLNKFHNLNLAKNLINLIQTLFILSCLISLINCADGDTTKSEANSRSNLLWGMGKGTVAVIIFIALGIIICILGLAFSSPGLFVFIGILLPLLVFIICISLPTGDDKDEEEDIYKNSHHDNYMVARWLYFVVMLLVFIALILPGILKWNIDVIPQRVNSNTMKDIYDDKYLEDLEKQKKRRYNLENESLDEEERLPLSTNKKKKNTFIRVDEDNNNNVNKNLFQNDLDEDNELPMARVKRKDELNDNRSKFKKFKRTQNSS